jgi:hypothetical protein
MVTAKMFVGNNQNTSLFKGENINQQLEMKSQPDFKMVSKQPQPAKIYTSSSLKSLVSSQS